MFVFFLFKKYFTYNRIWILYNSLNKEMVQIEQRDIKTLSEWRKDKYKNIEKIGSDAKLKEKINDNLFKKLEEGNAVIEKYGWYLIFKIKDNNSMSTINIDWEEFFWYSFRVKEKALIKFLWTN